MYKSHKLAQEPHRKEETHNFKNPFTTVCFFFHHYISNIMQQYQWSYFGLGPPMTTQD